MSWYLRSQKSFAVLIKKNLVFFLVLSAVLALFWAVTALVTENNAPFYAVSSFLGIVSYAVPFCIYLMIGRFIPEDFISINFVLKRIIIAVIVKFLLVIIFLGLIVKFIPCDLTVCFVSFFLAVMLQQLIFLKLDPKC